MLCCLAGQRNQPSRLGDLPAGRHGGGVVPRPLAGAGDLDRADPRDRDPHGALDLALRVPPGGRGVGTGAADFGDGIAFRADRAWPGLLRSRGGQRTVRDRCELRVRHSERVRPVAGGIALLCVAGLGPALVLRFHDPRQGFARDGVRPAWREARGHRRRRNRCACGWIGLVHRCSGGCGDRRGYTDFLRRRVRHRSQRVRGGNHGRAGLVPLGGGWRGAGRRARIALQFLGERVSRGHRLHVADPGAGLVLVTRRLARGSGMTPRLSLGRFRVSSAGPKRAFMLGVAIAAIGIVPAWLPLFYVTLLGYVGLATLVALGLVLLTGVSGQTSFGQATFVGLAAYSTTLLTRFDGASPLLGLVAGLILTGTIAWLLGLITARLSGHFLALVSVAWGISFVSLFGTLPFLHGFNGIGDIPPLRAGPLSAASPRVNLGVISAVTAVVMLISSNLLDSRMGRAIRTLNGARLMGESVGIDKVSLSRAVFVIAALYAGVSGFLFSHFQRFISPTPFNLGASIDYLFMIIIGGSESLWGAPLGAAVVVVARDQFNDWIPRITGRAGDFEALVFSLVVIVLMQRAPSGLMPLLARVMPVGRSVLGRSVFPSRALRHSPALHRHGPARPGHDDEEP